MPSPQRWLTIGLYREIPKMQNRTAMENDNYRSLPVFHHSELVSAFTALAVGSSRAVTYC